MQVPVLTAAEELTTAVCRSNSLTSGTGQSKNVVMVRAMRAMGVDYAENICNASASRRKTLSTPNRWAGFSVFHPNAGGAWLRGHGDGGFLVDPWFISKIENDQGGGFSKRNRK